MPEKKVKEIPSMGGLRAKELGRRVIEEAWQDDGFEPALQLWSSSSIRPAIIESLNRAYDV